MGLAVLGSDLLIMNSGPGEIIRRVQAGWRHPYAADAVRTTGWNVYGMLRTVRFEGPEGLDGCRRAA